jgi:hypothetical protein
MRVVKGRPSPKCPPFPFLQQRLEPRLDESEAPVAAPSPPLRSFVASEFLGFPESIDLELGQRITRARANLCWSGA